MSINAMSSVSCIDCHRVTYICYQVGEKLQPYGWYRVPDKGWRCPQCVVDDEGRKQTKEIGKILFGGCCNR